MPLDTCKGCLLPIHMLCVGMRIAWIAALRSQCPLLARWSDFIYTRRIKNHLAKFHDKTADRGINMNQKLMLSALPAITATSIIFYFIFSNPCPGTGNAALGCAGIGFLYLTLLGILLFCFLTLFFIFKTSKMKWFVYGVNILIFAFCVYSLIDLSIESMDNYKYEKNEQLKKEIRRGIEKAWTDPSNRSLILKNIKNIEDAKKEIRDDMNKEHAGLYLALYLEDNNKENLEKSHHIFSSTCYVSEDIVGHYDTLEYSQYKELFTYIKNNDKETYKINLLSCLPYEKRKSLDIKKLIQGKEFELAKIILDGSTFGISESTEILKEIKKIEDQNLKEELIKLLLSNYYYGSMYSTDQRVKEFTKLYPLVYEIQNKQDNYIKLLISNRNYQFYDEYKNNSCKHKEDILKFKEDYLRLESILDKNSPILDEVPPCAKDIFR